MEREEDLERFGVCFVRGCVSFSREAVFVMRKETGEKVWGGRNMR